MYKKIAVITFVIMISLVDISSAFWIWTPKDKKWTNPKWSAKNTPQEQFKYAKEILDSGDYKNAHIEFRKLIRHFPESLEAADAQFYIGECLEKMDKLYDAYLAYQKVIDKYAFNTRVDEILERQFKIAETLTSTKDKILGIDFPQYYNAITIYRKIIENAPYNAKFAPLSQYKIGLILKSISDFDEAKKEFEKVISSYPESEWAEAAKFQVAQSASLASLKSDYDQELTKDAKERFQEFLQKHPDAELSQQAQEQIQSLTEKEAEKDFSVGQFYEKQMAYASAKIYYEDVIKKYPNSVWAQKSLERLHILKKEDKL